MAPFIKEVFLDATNSMTSATRLFGRRWAAALSALAWMACSAPSLLAEPLPFVQAPWFGTAPKIDGQLNEAAWQKGKWSDEFVVANPEMPKAEPKTRFKVGVDRQYFYFAAVCERTPGTALTTEPRERDGSVFKDDSVEIMLHPLRSSDQYFHFAVNASGSLYDAVRVQGGGLANRMVNLSVQVATSVTDRYWTVEMAIPLAELELTSDVSRQWAINVARTVCEGKKPQVFTFARIQGELHKPNLFVPVELKALDVKPFLWSMRSQGESRVVEADGKLFLETQVSISNRGEDYTFFEMGVDVQQGAQFLGSASEVRGLDQGASRLYRMRIPVEGKGAALVSVSLRDPQQGTLLARLQYPVVVEYTPLRIHLTLPAYRNTIYATQRLDKIQGKVEINLPENDLAESRLTVFLEDATGQLLASTEVKEVASTVTFSIALPAEFGPGDYRVRALLEKNGEQREAGLPLSCLAPPNSGREVRLNEKKVTMVDGKPFLPIGAMMLKPQDDLETVAAQGYTVVMEYAFYWWKDETKQAWLDRLHQLGLMAVIYPYAKPEMGRGKALREPLDEAAQEAIRSLILKWRDHPALLGWYLADEPELHSTLPERLKQLHQLCRETDPYHPTIILNNTAPGADTYGEYCDILMPNPFPGFYQGGGSRRNMESVYGLVYHAAHVHGGAKALWMTPQAFNWADLRKERANERPPSFEDLRNMYYQGVIAGVTGFIPYSYQHGRRHPSIRLGLGYLARECNLLRDWILATPQTLNGFTGPGGVLHTLRKARNAHCLIVVNTTNQPLEFSATLPTAGEWFVVSEKRSIPVADKKLQDTLPPLGVRIYATDATLANRLDLEAAKHLIEQAPVLNEELAPLPDNERKGLPEYTTL